MPQSVEMVGSQGEVAREKYKWDEFIKHCPKLSQKVREVPNALLDVLGAGVPRQ